MNSVSIAALHGQGPASESVYGVDQRKPPRWSGLGFQVAVATLLGIVVGLLWPEFATSLKLLADIFLRLVKTVVAPLVFLTVVTGIISAGDFKRIGKIGLIAMIYFEIISTIALVWGMAIGLLSGVGKGVGIVELSAVAKSGTASATAASKASHASFHDFLLQLFPENFVGAFVRGETLQVLVIAILFGIALQMMKARRTPIENALNALSEAMFQFTNLIMRLAPIGAFGAMAHAIGANGTGVLVTLLWWVCIYYMTQVAFVLVVHGTTCAIFGINVFDVLRFIRDEIIIVLGTASSESVLPRLLEKMPNYGVSKQATGLVLPTGYVFNLDGAAIYMSMGVIFLANLYGVHLTWPQLGSMLALMLLTSKGVATVTGGAFVTFAATATAIGILPLEGLPLMFGVYRLMSPANATCNAISNAIATVVIGKISGEYRSRISISEVTMHEAHDMQATSPAGHRSSSSLPLPGEGI